MAKVELRHVRSGDGPSAWTMNGFPVIRFSGEGKAVVDADVWEQVQDRAAAAGITKIADIKPKAAPKKKAAKPKAKAAAKKK